jgi:hypothetical protein
MLSTNLNQKYFKGKFFIALILSLILLPMSIDANFTSTPSTTPLNIGDTFSYTIQRSGSLPITLGSDAPDWLSLKEDSVGSLSTVIGNPSDVGDGDIPLTTTRINQPISMAYNSTNHSLYITSWSNTEHLIQELDLGTKTLSTIAGGSRGNTNGSLANAKFNDIRGLLFDAPRNSLYISDAGSGNMRKIDLNNNTSDNDYVTTLATKSYMTPMRMALSKNNNDLYFVNLNGSQVEKIDLTDNNALSIIKTGILSRGLGYDAIKNKLYVSTGQKMKSIDLDNNNTVTTLAGSGTWAYVDGVGSNASVERPNGMAFDSSKNALYFTSQFANTIRKLDILTNEITTIAGKKGVQGFVDGLLGESLLNYPLDLTTDRDGNVYIADFTNRAIRKLSFDAASASYTLTGTVPDTAWYSNPITLEMSGTSPQLFDLTINGGTFRHSINQYGFNIGTLKHIGIDGKGGTNTLRDHNGFDITGFKIDGFNRRNFHKNGRFANSTTGDWFDASKLDKDGEVDLDKDGRPNWQQNGRFDDMDGDGIKNYADINKKFKRKKEMTHTRSLHIKGKELGALSTRAGIETWNNAMEAADKIAEIIANDTDNPGTHLTRRVKEGSIIIEVDTLYEYYGDSGDISLLSCDTLITQLGNDSTFTATFGTNLSCNDENQVVYWNEGGSTATISSDTELVLTHSVDRKSSFSFSSNTNTIETAGTTKIGSCTLENNTRDGFELSVSSMKKGVLEAQDTKDGEVNIPYTLQLTKLNAIGKNLSFKSEHLAEDYETGTSKIINFNDGASIVESSTEVSMVINVIVDASHKKAMTLAGDYTDTLTFTYQDL